MLNRVGERDVGVTLSVLSALAREIAPGTYFGTR
jgi:hypothetical protein